MEQRELSKLIVMIAPAHVDFTALAEVASEEGLSVAGSSEEIHAVE